MEREDKCVLLENNERGTLIRRNVERLFEGTNSDLGSFSDRKCKPASFTRVAGEYFFSGTRVCPMGMRVTCGEITGDLRKTGAQWPAQNVLAEISVDTV